jgi:hypothetical protein
MTPVFSEVYSPLSAFPTENATGAVSQESSCYGKQRNPGAATRNGFGSKARNVSHRLCAIQSGGHSESTQGDLDRERAFSALNSMRARLVTTALESVCSLEDMRRDAGHRQAV